MKRIDRIVIAIMLMLCAHLGRAFAQELIPASGATEGRFYFGYCSLEEPKHYLATDSKTEQAMFARYAPSMMKPFIGAKIIGVRVGIPGTIKDAKVILKEKITSPNLKEKSASLQKGWNEILFDEPYTITAAEVSVGLQVLPDPAFDGAVLLCSMDKQTTAPKADAFYWQPVGSSQPPQSLTKEHGNLLVQAIIVGLPAVTNDRVVFEGYKLPLVKNPDGTSDVRLGIRNVGANKVQSITLDYSINAGAPVSKTFDGDIAVQYLRNHTITGIVANKGDKMRITIRSVNGKTVPDGANTLDLTLNMVDKAFPRKALLEIFSTEECTNCPKADARLDKVIHDQFAGRVVSVIHHVGYKTDKFTLDESKTFFPFYSDGPFAPAMMLDRTVSTLLGPETSHPAHAIKDHVEGYPAAFFAEAVERPSPLSISIDETFDPATRELVVTVSGQIIPEQIKPEECMINVWITEDDVYSRDQIGAGWEDEAAGIRNPYYHQHLLRRYLSPVGGRVFKLKADSDTEYTTKFTTTIPAEWNEARLNVLAFVARPITGMPFNAEVHNAEVMRLKEFVSVSPLATDAQVKAYASAHQIATTVPCDQITIYSLSGTVMPHGSDLPSGLYLVRMIKAGKLYIQKVVL